ncbi:SDR family NAD(P)-dependent oxidoreductase [Mycolicibacterium phlei]|uniref:Oxidoreductase n=1 Tax=Mycolicibacterium phlei DSM 43239 = CCUG 21000 TaxID=1226750 RepID=A0A5N5UWC5_MYCPH|nr:SDR family oxidoreductase [Mycolicibacterium phlei]KAB7753905.1 oxidoreductase [Mycolicibacterium phlei DSM 43239 = CCUG 21000]KXW65459.1 oxidoreductase [Mycolicibacterium phlei DSM 43239 = CCUG 21000]KXW65810.1 oxidoreductase [Mycolicibacterium phlei DSM 43070]KXW66159.1 oxidoreductase [Mycolicibacterium phlei DSM 43072]KXW76966.1 oxidoreductase [Mycolicibacterium phlei DSM 43071]
MQDRFTMEGRVAVITGGGTGIGRGTALTLAERGADIVLAGRRAEPLKSTAAEVEALGRRALAVPTDVTEPDACRALVATTLDEFGHLDVLVNNAGGGVTKPIMKWTDEEWQQVLDLNLSSVWYLSRAAVEPMINQGKGAIVNISSGASLLAMPQAVAYAAAKAGLNNLTGSMAAAWTRKGVRVNGIACGAIRTPGLESDVKRQGFDIDMIGQSNGAGRIGEPDEIGYGVLFFASDASSFCSGQTLYMHGAPGPAGV